MFAGHIRDWRVELIWRVIYHNDNDCSLSGDTILYETRDKRHKRQASAGCWT